MKRELDTSLLSSGSLLRRGYSFLAENAGKTVAIITGIVATLVSFTEIGFCDFRAESFGVSMAVMLLATYIIFFSLEDAGERLGRESEVYKDAHAKYCKLKERIKGTDTASLREFCTLYREKELEYRRSSLMLHLEITEAEYKEALTKSSQSRKIRRAARRIKRQKPLHLTPSLLLGGTPGRGESELADPGRGKHARMLLSLLPTAICTVFTVSIMLVGKDGMTPATVIESLLKLSCLPIVGIRGYSRGYTYVTEGQCRWLDTKSRLLEAFLDGIKAEQEA